MCRSSTHQAALVTGIALLSVAVALFGVLAEQLPRGWRVAVGTLLVALVAGAAAWWVRSLRVAGGAPPRPRTRLRSSTVRLAAVVAVVFLIATALPGGARSDVASIEQLLPMLDDGEPSHDVIGLRLEDEFEATTGVRPESGVPLFGLSCAPIPPLDLFPDLRIRLRAADSTELEHIRPGAQLRISGTIVNAHLANRSHLDLYLSDFDAQPWPTTEP